MSTTEFSKYNNLGPRNDLKIDRRYNPSDNWGGPSGNQKIGFGNFEKPKKQETHNLWSKALFFELAVNVQHGSEDLLGVRARLQGANLLDIPVHTNHELASPLRGIQVHARHLVGEVRLLHLQTCHCCQDLGRTFDGLRRAELRDRKVQGLLLLLVSESDGRIDQLLCQGVLLDCLLVPIVPM